MQHTYKFIISTCLLFFSFCEYSQNQKKDTVLNIKKDSILYNSYFGLRLGIDVSKPILSQTDDSYSGFEILSDYKISDRFYAAIELGTEKKTTEELYTNSTAKGNYIRLGFNYNVYKNWLNMNNEIFLGYRYGFSSFEQTLNSYKVNVNTQYFPAKINEANKTSTGLNAHWSELMFGIKAEVFKYIFISFSGSYKILMSIKDPENFKSLYSPGFNRVFESNTGFGFNYSITYLITF